MASRGPQRPGGQSEAGAREHARDIRLLLAAEHDDPFSFLGMHPRPDGTLGVRVFRPDARAVTVRAPDGARFEGRRIHPEGLFEAVIASRDPFPYELETTDRRGEVAVERDPYSFPPLVGDYDQYLFNEGTHCEADRFLGAHLCTKGGCDGVAFALWAPAASRVSVVGDFNGWDGRRHPMRRRRGSGIWELFVPHLGAGAVYKYEIRTAGGELLLKADPYAFRSEAPPRTASVACDLTAFQWSDADWMRTRGEREWLREPLAIYEVHLGSWRRGEGGRTLGYRELAQPLVDYVAELGYTHVELMPVAEHPFGGSWGYQVSGYFAPTARFGEPADFAWFVDLCHRRGIGVLIDWVPGHFPDDAHGLARFDGTHLYEHADPRQGRHPDWGTSIFNSGRREVASFLLSNARFWFDRYHVDGLRVDAVASMLYLDYSRREGEWVPNAQGGRENLESVDFMRRMNTEIGKRFPGALTIAEESTSWPGVSRPAADGGLGFGYKWNMGWMNDVLRYMSRDPVHRRHHQSDLTFGMLYAYGGTSCCRCRTTRSFTARDPCWGACRAAIGSGLPTCGCCSPSCTGTRGRSSCSWEASSGSGRSGTATGRSTGICSSTPPTGESSAWPGTSMSSTASTRASTASTPILPASSGSTATTRTAALCRSGACRRRPRTESSCLRATSLRLRAGVTGSGCRCRVGTRSSSTRTQRSTAAAAGMAPGWKLPRTPGTAWTARRR